MPELPSGMPSIIVPSVSFSDKTNIFINKSKTNLAFPEQVPSDFVAYNETILQNIGGEYGRPGRWMNSALVAGYITGRQGEKGGIDGLVGQRISFTPDTGSLAGKTIVIDKITSQDAGRILAYTIIHETIWHKSGITGEGVLNPSNSLLKLEGVYIGVNNWNNIIPYGYVIPLRPARESLIPLMDHEQLIYLAKQLGYIEVK